MKINKKVIIAGAALLTFAACKTEMKQPTEAEIDALVSEKVEAVKKQLQEDCDASLLAAANAEVDKILMAEANKPAKVVTAPAPKPKAKKKKPTPKPVVKKKKPETVGNGKPKMGGSKGGNTVGQGKPKMGASTNAKSGNNTTIGNGKPKMGGK